MAVDTTTDSKGRVIQVIGPVIDLEFPSGHLPSLLNAVVVEKDQERGGPIVVEVEQHLGNNWVRCVAMDSTEGVRRGATATDTGSPMEVPVGPPTLGRMFNVLGQPIDGLGPVATETRFPIHRDAPKFEDQIAESQVFETGLKVIDLVATFTRGGKIGIY